MTTSRLQNAESMGFKSPRSEAHVFASLDAVRMELETILKAIGKLQEQGHPVRIR